MVSNSRRQCLQFIGSGLGITLAGCFGKSGSYESPTGTKRPSITATEDRKPTELDPKWAVSSFDGAVRDLALDSTTLYASLPDGQIIALDPTTGDENWRIALTGTIEGQTLTLANPQDSEVNPLYVETSATDESREYLYSIDPATGKTRWTFETLGSLGVEMQVGDILYLQGATPPKSSPSPSQDVETDGRLFALAVETGQEHWQRSITDLRALDAAAHGVYVADGPTLRAFSHDGEERWTVTAVNDEIRPAVIEELVLFGTTDKGDLSAYTGESGEQQWTVTTWGDGPEGITVTGDRVYLTSDQLMALNHSGKTLWQNDHGGSFRGISVTKDPLIVERPQSVAALSPDDGKNLWSFNPEDGKYVYARAVTHSSLVVNWSIGQDYEYLFLDKETGNKQSRFATGLPFYTTATRNDWLFIGSEGHVYAIDVSAA